MAENKKYIFENWSELDKEIADRRLNVGDYVIDGFIYCGRDQLGGIIFLRHDNGAVAVAQEWDKLILIGNPAQREGAINVLEKKFNIKMEEIGD